MLAMGSSAADVKLLDYCKSLPSGTRTSYDLCRFGLGLPSQVFAMKCHIDNPSSLTLMLHYRI